MTPRLLLLTLLPLLAAEPPLSVAAGQPLIFPDEQFAEQLQRAQELARRAGEDLMRSLQILESAIPRYGVPFIDEQGNIVIPRRHYRTPRGTPVPEAGPSPT